MKIPTSTTAVGLDGSLTLRDGLASVAADTLGRYALASLEIAMPVLAALLLAELTLGVASRLLPQANVFLLGLPLKLLVAFAVVGVTLVSFPEVMHAVLAETARLFEQIAGGLST